VSKDVDELLRAVLSGDVQAWADLQTQIAPRITAIARGHDAMRVRRLNVREDDVAEIVTATLERLARSDFRSLRRYLEHRDQGDVQKPQSFDAWVYGAVDFAIREHLRRRYGRTDRVVGSDGPPQLSKRDLHTGAVRLDAAPIDRSFVHTLGATARLTVAQVFAHIEANFTPEETQAMRLYYAQDKNTAEVAVALQLPNAKAAEKLIRKLNARLRSKFLEP
jgi:hypothetical protein